MAGLFASASTASFAEAPGTSLWPVPRPDGAVRSGLATEDLVRGAGLGGGKVGFVVADARNGRVLEAMNPLLQLPPASVTKAVTALYALDKLGSGHRFRTRLLATGPIRGGQLQGDLILVGGGDPTLTTDMLGDMARALKAAGVLEVTGQFRVHSAALPYVREIDAEQPDHLSYNPAISGLNLNFNRVHFEWKRAQGGYEITMQARAERYRPAVLLTRMRVVNRQSPVYTYSQAQGRENWTVAQAALGAGGSRWLPVRRPDSYAAEVFRTLARSHGIQLRQARPVSTLSNATVVVEQPSAELRLILRDMLRYSTNLTAEVIGLGASSANGQRVRSLRSSARQMQSWLGANLGADRARFVDHSGLGEGSLVSASEMSRALVRTGPDGPLRGIMKEIKLVDDKGRPMRNQPIEIRAKTGTLNFVSSLCGYMRTPGGRDLAFAVFSADKARRARISPDERERPRGARAWTGRARRLQQQLIEHWAAAFDA